MSKKEVVILSVFVFGITCFCVYLYWPFTMQTNTDNQMDLSATSITVPVNEVSQVETLPLEEPTKSAIKFEKVDFPQQTKSPEECHSSVVDQAYFGARFKIIQVATQAYLAGSDKEDTANAIWAVLGWSDANDWYKKALDYESLSIDLSLLQSTPELQAITSKVEAFNGRLASGSVTEKLPDLSQEKMTLWSNIDVQQLNQAILLGESTGTILSIINRLFSHLPDAVLTNTQISPIRGLIPSLVSSKRLDVAVALLKQYRTLFEANNHYEHRLRAEILAALNFDLDTSKLKEEANSLLTLLKLYDQNIVLYEYHLLMDRLRLKDVIDNLAEQNINVPYQVVTDLDLPESTLDLNAEKQALEEANALSMECDAQLDWLRSRNFKFSDLSTFEQDDFITNVSHSFEYAYCESKPPSINMEDTSKQLEKISSTLRDLISQNDNSFAQVDLNELDLSGLNKEARAILGGFLTRKLFNSKAISREQIIQRLSEINLIPKSQNIEIMQDLLSMKGFEIWVDEIEFDEIPQSYRLLHSLAKSARFELFKKLEPKIDTSQAHMYDPFYFFVLNYSSFYASSPGSLTFKPGQTDEFIEYFLQNGVEIKAHHRRAAFKRKMLFENDYKDLIVHFPDLAVSEDNDYFSVTCD